MFDDGELNRLYRYCRALCDSEADAYDLLQGGVERCLRRPPRDGSRRLSYAMRVMGNLRRDELRRRRVVTFEPLDDEPTSLDTQLAGLEEMVITEDALDAVWGRLSEVEREILFLWAVEGYSLTEVAEHLGRPRGTVLSMVHRLRKRVTATDNPERARG